MRPFSVFCKRSYLCDLLITSSDALGWKMLDLSHSLSLLCPTNILSFFLHRVLCWLWLWVLTAARITLTRAGLDRDSTRFNGSLTAQHTTILRLTQELQLIMFNQVFIFRHAAGFTYGIIYWAMENEFCRDFFPFKQDIIISGCKMRLYKIFH